jgi:hypothetical protein
LTGINAVVSLTISGRGGTMQVGPAAYGESTREGGAARQPWRYRNLDSWERVTTLIGTGLAAVSSEPAALRERPSARNSVSSRFNLLHATVHGRA